MRAEEASKKSDQYLLKVDDVIKLINQQAEYSRKVQVFKDKWSNDLTNHFIGLGYTIGEFTDQMNTTYIEVKWK